MVKKTRIAIFILGVLGFCGMFFVARHLMQQSTRQKSGNPAEATAAALTQHAHPKEFRKSYLTITSRLVSPDSLLLLTNNSAATPIEQAILSAALQRREGKPLSAYEKLVTYIGQRVLYYEYYDELLAAAVASGKVGEVQKQFSSLQDTTTAQYYYFRGVIEQSLSKFAKAAEYYAVCLQRDSDAPLAVLREANCLVNAGKSDLATSRLAYSRQLVDADPATRTESRLLQGVIAYYLGDVQKAGKWYDEALGLARENGLVTYESRAMVNQGIVLDQAGKLQEARQLYRSAAAKAREINDSYSTGLAFGELGVSYSFTSELADALEQYKTALHWYSQIGNEFRLALTYANIGYIYVAIGDLPSAKSTFEKGLAYSKNSPRAQCLNAIGLGDIYTNTGNYAEALRLYEQAREQLQNAKLFDLRSAVNLSVGALSYGIGRYQSTIRVCTESLEGAENAINSPTDVTRLYRQTGLAYYGMDSLHEALECFEEAKKIAGQFKLGTDKFRVLVDEANVLIDNDMSKEAGARLAEAQPFVSGVQSSEQLYFYASNLRYALAAKNMQLAARALAEGEKLSSRATHQETKADFLFETARYYQTLGNHEKASANYIASISLLESSSTTLLPYQKLHISRRTAVYDLYRKVIAYFIQQQRYDEAFTILDHARAKNSFYAINERMFANANFTKDDFEQYQKLGWMVESGLYDKKTVDSLLVVRHVYELKGKLAGFFHDEGYIQSPKSYIASIQEKLGENSYVVSLFTDDAESRYFIISRHGFVSVAAPQGKEAVKDLLSQVSMRFAKGNGQQLSINPDLFAFHAGKANQLYEKVFRPAFELIPEGASVVFIPSEEFYSFPLELLVKSFNATQSPYKYANVDYLVGHYTISSAPSAEIFTRLMDPRGTDIADALVIGNPTFGSGRGVYAERRGLFEDQAGVPRNVTLYPLKYSEDEIESVRDKFKSVAFYNGTSATETNFKANAERSSIIHLSTHSWLIGKQPAIFFSPEKDTLNDGILEAGEVAQMNLHADLVSLSSCNSGEGMHEASEGIVGMTKAFLDAGASSVVVSLWEVNDRYTAEFMKLFYASLRDGKSKSEALREAKQKFIRDISPNPYYWSGFVLVGNTEPLPAGVLNTSPFILVLLGATAFLALMLILLRKLYRIVSSMHVH